MSTGHGYNSTMYPNSFLIQVDQGPQVSPDLLDKNKDLFPLPLPWVLLRLEFFLSRVSVTES